MTVVISEAASEEGDEEIVDHALCVCGRLAAVVLVADEDSTSCSVRCPCGRFAPADAEGDRS